MAIGLIGLWLLVRGATRLVAALRGAQRGVAVPHHHDHGHHHSDHHGEDCGHAHGPSIEEIARVASWRDAALLVGAVAARPCSGALLLLILTWQLGIGWSGVAGACAMALGTAMVGIAVAVPAVAARESLPAGAARLGWLRIALPVAELGAGGAIVLMALSLPAAG